MSLTEAPHHPVSPAILEAFERRAIDAEIVTRHGVYTARRPEKDAQGKSGTPIPDVRGSVVCYPYHDEHGAVVNTKYLARKGKLKLYFQQEAGRKVFYNLPIMLAPELRAEGNPAALLIVEGENDTLAGETAGYPFVTSVPDGGSPDVDKQGRPIPMKPDSELDPENDTKFSYIAECWHLIGDIPRIILWTDWDGVGERLRQELARRLGKVRCSFVDRPSWATHELIDAEEKDRLTGEVRKYKRPVKDLNEVLQHYGKEAVMECIESAKPIPMTGLYKLSDFQEQTRILYSTGFKALDPYIQLYRGAFVVISGVPQSGKSQLWNQIAFNMAMNHRWHILIASFEAEIKPDIVRQLRAFYLRKPYGTWNSADRAEADKWIEAHFCFVTRDPTGIEDVQASAEWLCEKIGEAVIRYGIDMALIDPWNQLDHQRRPGEMRDEYTIRCIKMVKDTGKRLGVCTAIVAHPDKAAGKAAKDGEVMSLYDISDGAAWINAAELGVIVRREDMRGDTTEVYARKVKFRGTGRVGHAALLFLEDEERFDETVRPTPHPDDVEAPRRRH